MSSERAERGAAEALSREWAIAPPDPDLRAHLTPAILADDAALVELVRCDALERYRKGRDARLEHYRAVLPDHVVPGTQLSRLLIALESSFGPGETPNVRIEALRARPGSEFLLDFPLNPVVGLLSEAATVLPPTVNAPGRGMPAAHATDDALLEPARREPELIVAGRYRLVGRLDVVPGRGAPRGSFGEVWEAQRLMPIGEGADPESGEANAKHTVQKLAIKFIRRNCADADVLKRFTEVEPRALARLAHPYVARFHELAFHRGEPFLVMEFVRGGTILEYADAKRLSLDQRIRLVVKVCDGLQHVHGQGLIHRDLKPANILVAESEGAGVEGIPKLIDFGLAKSTTSEPLASQIGTEAFGGTRPYASPEQFARYPHESLTRAVDVYGIGAVLFELLTSATPMQHVLNDPDSPALQKESRCASEGRPSLLDAFKMLTPEQQLRASEDRGTTVAAMCRELGSGLSLVIESALHVEPARRLQEVSHLREDLENYLDGLPFRHSRREPLASKIARRVRRNRLAYGLGTAAVILLILSAGVAAAFALSERRARQHMERAQIVAAQVRAYVNEDLLGSGEVVDRYGINVPFVRVIEAAALQLDNRFPAQPLVEGELRLTIGGSLLPLGRHKLADIQFRRAAVLFARDHQEWAGRLRAAAGLGEVLWRQGRQDEAKQVLESALAVDQHLAGLDDPSYLSAQHSLASMLKHDGKLDDAERMYREVLAGRSRILPPTNPDILVVHYNLALVELERGKHAMRGPSPDIETANRYFETTLQLLRAVAEDERDAGLPETHHLLLQADLEIAGALFRLGRFHESRRTYEGVLPRMQSQWQADHWRILLALAGRARSSQMLGDRELAVVQTVEALKGYEGNEEMGPAHIGAITLRHRLAECRYDVGDREGATQLLKKNYALSREGRVNTGQLAAFANDSSALCLRRSDSAGAQFWTEMSRAFETTGP